MMINNQVCNLDNQGIEVLTAKELKVVMRCGINKAYALMQSPAFPSIKVGGRYIVTVSALNEWLKIHQGKNYLI